ncbi:MAG: M23 family metallopeptidase [Mycobacteriales bacterium]
MTVDALDRKAVLSTAASDPATAQHAARPEARVRNALALGVLVLAMPFLYGARAERAQAHAAPIQPVIAYSAPVEGYDRPSSESLGAAELEALSTRTIGRASRDAERVAIDLPAALPATRPAAATAAVVAARSPLAVVRPTVGKPKPTSGSQWKAARWVRPAGGRFTSGYKYRWGRMHKGIDLASSTGTPIYAASDGVVTFAGAAGGYGRLVTIRHAGGYTTAYGHMSKIKVSTGERVKAGEIIALVGSAGHSTGPHLHFEVRTGGGTINPVPFLAKRGVYI